MRDKDEIMTEIYKSPNGQLARQAAMLEVLLDIRELLGKDLPAMLADINKKEPGKVRPTWICPL